MKQVIFILIVIIIGCNSHNNPILNEKQEYSRIPLIEWVNGYLAEQEEPNYLDNIIYNDCLEVIYEYKYIKNNYVRYFEYLSFRKWKFIDSVSLNNGLGVQRIRVSAPNPNDNYLNPPQSAVKYELLNSDNEIISTSNTGVVENFKNIIIHNPRSGFFLALFSFPWPTVKFPIEENPSWTWKFAYDSKAYGDDRLFNWEGITEMKYEYKYLGEETIKLKFGEIETSKYEAIGSNGLLNNKLIYHFNSKLGFVKQTFLTFDGAKIELYAVDYKNKCMNTSD